MDPKALPTLADVRYERAKRSLASFIRQAWDIVEPDKTLLWGWHLDYLCELLEAVTFEETPIEAFRELHGLGDEPIRKLIVNEPPGYMKSLIITVMWPCWSWIHKPGTRALFASYSQDLSTQHSVSRRLVIESPWYSTGMRDHWGHENFGLQDDQNVKTHYDNTARGRMIATSVGGMATGTHGDVLVIDDPLDPQQAFSDTKREACNTWFDQKFNNRVRDKRTSVRVLVMQRVHQDDLTGHLLETGEWLHVCLPCVAEKRETIVFPRSGRVVVRKPDDLLWPEREGPAEVEANKKVGSYYFAGQYQQRPAPLEGGIIKRSYFRYWVRERMDSDGDDVIVLPSNLTDHLQSWDMTYWDTPESDYCVGQAWARYGASCFLLDQTRARRDLPASKQAVRDFTAAHPKARKKLIENAANGAEVLRKMRDEIPGLVGRSANKNKVARVMERHHMLEARNVVIPHPREAAWVSDFIAECLSFPNVEHDDQVDGMTQALAEYDHASGTDAPQFGQRKYGTGGTNGNPSDAPRVAVR